MMVLNVVSTVYENTTWKLVEFRVLYYESQDKSNNVCAGFSRKYVFLKLLLQFIILLLQYLVLREL